MVNGWVDDEALEAMKMESRVFGEGLGSQTNPEIANRLYEENVVGATMSIIHVARHAPNYSTRFAAAKYIVDRVLGSSRKEGMNETVDPLEKFVQELAEGVKEGPTQD